MGPVEYIVVSFPGNKFTGRIGPELVALVESGTVRVLDLIFIGKDAEGNVLNSATIITTEAGPDMPIHNRQPVVLEPETWDLWLDPSMTDVEKLQPLLVPTIRGTLVRHPVSRDVGNVRNNGPELVEAIALEGDPGQNSA